jgi:hypothetical protein
MKSCNNKKHSTQLFLRQPHLLPDMHLQLAGGHKLLLAGSTLERLLSAAAAATVCKPLVRPGRAQRPKREMAERTGEAGGRALPLRAATAAAGVHRPLVGAQVPLVAETLGTLRADKGSLPAVRGQVIPEGNSEMRASLNVLSTLLTWEGPGKPRKLLIVSCCLII